MEGGSLPSPNFDAKDTNTGFIPFSSTPVHGSNFKPKFGKKNRVDNWTRFGRSEGLEGSHNSRSPGYRSHNNSGFRNHNHSGEYSQDHRSPKYGNFNNSGEYRSPGGSQGHNTSGENYHQDQAYTNQGYRHSPRGRGYSSPQPRRGNGTPRGGGYGGGVHQSGGSPSLRGSHRGRGNWNNRSQNSFESNTSGSTASHFHPSMIEDPWKYLENQRARRLNHSARSSKTDSFSDSSHLNQLSNTQVKSESMIPMVGDSLMQRNQELNETEEVPENTS